MNNNTGLVDYKLYSDSAILLQKVKKIMNKTPSNSPPTTMPLHDLMVLQKDFPLPNLADSRLKLVSSHPLMPPPHVKSELLTSVWQQQNRQFVPRSCKGKRTRTQSSLVNRCYQCFHCEKGYGQVSHLNTHVKKIHGGRPIRKSEYIALKLRNQSQQQQ
eukprot:NODE_580_length_5759_cov_0.735512.p3 type:complete len:159 gc:universal NODE_580_length_5759_cov_0.735512:706-230(-)